MVIQRMKENSILEKKFVFYNKQKLVFFVERHGANNNLSSTLIVETIMNT